MRKFFFILLFCLLITNSLTEITFAETYSYSYPRRYYNKNFNVLPQNNLKALEKYALQRSYTRDAELSRLERLEELAFGSIQSGDINTRYKNVENAILSNSQNNYRQTWQRRVNNYFSGQPTGITPGITQVFSQNYMPEYSNSRVEQFNNSFWNRGYRINNNNYSTGSGVRLLD